MTWCARLFVGWALVLAALARLAMPAAGAAGDVGAALVPALVFGVAVAGGPVAGAVAGLGCGAVLDLAPPADHPIGQWAFVLGVCGAAVGAALRCEQHLPRIVIAAIGVAVVGPVLFTAVGLGVGDPHAHVQDWGSTVPTGAITIALSLLVLPATRRVLRVALPEPRPL